MASSSRGGVSYPQSKVIPWGIVAKMWGFVTNVELYRGELSPTVSACAATGRMSGDLRRHGGEYDTEAIRVPARHAPHLTDTAARMFALEDAARLRSLFQDAGFRDVETATEAQRITRPSFAAYFEPYERGGGAIGQAYAALPGETRRTVREEVRRALGDTGGPIRIECQIRLARGTA
jgi:hypothetical protein